MPALENLTAVRPVQGAVLFSRRGGGGGAGRGGKRGEKNTLQGRVLY